MQNIADINMFEFAMLGTTNLGRITAQTCTLVTAANDIINPRSFANVTYDQLTTTSGGISHTNPISINMTDNNGNGFLIATDRIFIVAGGVATTNGVVATAKILYRLVNVDVMEFLGIVQSQQSGG